MMKISYLSLEEALQIHQSTIINSGGGDMGELDVGKLDSVLKEESLNKRRRSCLFDACLAFFSV